MCGLNYTETDLIVLHVIPYFIILVAIICNISLALFGSFLWIISIEYSCIEDFVLEARKILEFCDGLLILTVQFVQLGIFLASFLNLYPNWPEIVVMVVLAYVIQYCGKSNLGHLHYNILPLEIFHYPHWVKAIFMPKSVFNHKERESVEERAKARANLLKAKAYQQRKLRDPTISDSDRATQTNTSVGSILRTAAINLGRSDYDVSAFEARLEEDWYNEADLLKEEDVDTLSRYMPRMLAKEVHKILSTERYEKSRRSTFH